MNVAQLQKAIRQLGKTANQRLRELEKIGLTKASQGYKEIQRQSYDGMRYLGKTSKGEVKFDLSLGTAKKSKKTVNELREELTAINNFLNARTSTVSGIKNISGEAYKKYKEMGYKGSQKSYEDFAEGWSRGLMQNLKECYGSTEANQIRLTYQDLDDYTLEKILRKAGFDESSTPDNKPDLNVIYRTYREYRKQGV